MRGIRGTPRSRRASSLRCGAAGASRPAGRSRQRRAGRSPETGDPTMATWDDRFRQAAWTYVAYGVVYWLGGLALAQSGLGPRGMERGGTAWFVIGALFVVGFPWLLVRDRPWFD